MACSLWLKRYTVAYELSGILPIVPAAYQALSGRRPGVMGVPVVGHRSRASVCVVILSALGRVG